MAEADIPAQSRLGKQSIPSYEEPLALVESMMTCYDTPLTQAAGCTRDLLKTLIALKVPSAEKPSQFCPISGNGYHAFNNPRFKGWIAHRPIF